ncbi:MAG: helix-turn-helix transcriptional regulator [Lachnospiraceae bacterium]|nr:helix-turn-helix transcriptional regulator [Lachnospiraceae bacterium]
MFGERLRGMLELLEITGAELARMSGCDKSNVSRMVSGARVPKNGGAGARRLVNALYFCADEKGRVDELCDLISCENRDSADDIKEQMMLWLYDGEKTAVKADFVKEKIPYRALGERLGAVMELAGLSNVRLGKLLNLDPSYISRFRSGFRSPKANQKMMNDLCLILLERMEARDTLPALCKLIDAASDVMTDKEMIFDLLYRWLYQTDRTDHTSFVEGVIDQIGSIQADVKMPPILPEGVMVDETLLPGGATADETMEENVQVYCGVNGLRRAVLRFLGNVVKRKEKELFLYSDQSMDWMVSDPAFRAKWASLMILCITGGTQINIIHNINRDLAEMADAIKSWLPLYPSGKVKSYYCKTRGSERFSTTLFLCPGYACISGSNVIGAEDEHGIYRYDTDPQLLKAHEAAYQELLGRSGELAHVYKTTDVDPLVSLELPSATILGNTLSLATMPEKTLTAILERMKVSEEVKEHIVSVREQRNSVLSGIIDKGGFHEYAPLPREEELFEERVPIDLPGLHATYTPKEYAEHIQNIISLSDRMANYRFHVLPEAPFEDIKIVISDKGVAVMRQKAPYLIILFEHPDICRAFAVYVEGIRGQYQQDKLSTKKQLERYL